MDVHSRNAITLSAVNSHVIKSEYANVAVCLESANGVDLGDQHTGTSTPHGEGASLSDISVACHEGALSTNHHISGAHDTVRQRVAAAIHVVELGLGHAVIDVDGREKQLTLGCHLAKAMHTCGGLLADTLALGSHGGCTWSCRLGWSPSAPARHT